MLLHHVTFILSALFVLQHSDGIEGSLLTYNDHYFNSSLKVTNKPVLFKTNLFSREFRRMNYADKIGKEALKQTFNFRRTRDAEGGKIETWVREESSEKDSQVWACCSMEGRQSEVSSVNTSSTDREDSTTQDRSVDLVPMSLTQGDNSTEECETGKCVDVLGPGTSLNKQVVSSFLKLLNNNSDIFLQILKNESQIAIIEDLDNNFNLDELNIIFMNETKITMLHAAVKSGNCDVVVALLEAGLDPNDQDMHGFTALHASVAKRNKDIVNALLSNGNVDLDKQDSEGATALHLAAILDEKEIVEKLLDRGANPYIADFKGSNVLHLAAVSGEEILSLVLQVNHSMVDETDQFQRSPLYLSATKGVPGAVKILLSYNATPDIPDILGRTPLMVVVARNDETMCELLLNGGADPFYSKNMYKMTPFHLAVSLELLTIANKMLNVSSRGINLLNIENKTPLFMAVSMHNIPMVKLLLEHGADPYVPLFDRNWTVLHIVGDLGLEAVAKLVLEHNSSGIDFQNHLGQTALYRSLLRKRTQIFDLLMEHGADFTIPSNAGTTPLIVASGECSLHVVKEILNRRKDQINKQNSAGGTALLIAATRNCSDTFEYLLSKGALCHIPSNIGWAPLHAAVKANNDRMVELILQTNISTVNDQDTLGQTPLYVSVSSSSKDIFMRLLYISSDPYAQTKLGFTVLHQLVMSQKIKHVEELLMFNKSGINIQENEGMTALYGAALINDFPMFALILKEGADPYICDNLGVTPLHVAVFKNETEIAGHLLSANASGINLQNGEGYTALHLSIEYPTILEELLKKGANQFIREQHGKIPLHFAATNGISRSVNLLLANNDSVVDICDKADSTALHMATDGNYTEVFIALISKSANTNLITLGGVIPLQIASDQGNLLFVEMLLNRSSSLINHQTYEGFTALHFATHKNHTDIVRLLLKSGSNPEIPDYNGYTCHHFAARKGLYQILEIFVKSKTLSLNVENIEGFTPLAMAAYAGQEEVFKLLLKNGGSLIHIDSLGRTILHAAAIGENKRIVDIVLNITTASLNTTDVFGMTPLLTVCKDVDLFRMFYAKGANPFFRWRGFTALHFAAHFGHVEVLERILEDYPEGVNISNHAGISPLTIAHFSKQRQAIEFLLKHGANVLSINVFSENILHYSNHAIDTKILVDVLLKAIIDKLNHFQLDLFINQANAHGLTPIAKAAMYGNSILFQALLNLGSLLNTRSVEGDSILHVAAQGGSFPILDFLLQHTSIPINIKNFEGVTPVMKAVLGGNELGFDTLALQDADLTTVSNFKETMLHFAAIGSSYAIIERLISTGTYVIDAKDAEGFTPLMQACIHGNNDIVKLLLKFNADPLMKNIYGETSIELAARQGNAEILKLFSSVEYDADALLGTVLTRSIQFKNDTDVILHLLDRSTISNNPIFLYSAKGDDAELMIALAESNNPTVMKIPKIMKTFMKEYDSLLDELITRENHTVPTNFEKHVSPLDIALMFFGKPSTVRLLVDRLQININKLEEQKAMWSPLDYAIYSMERYSGQLHDKYPVLHYLLGVMNITDNIKNYYGWSTVHKAAWFGNLVVVQLLKRKGADLHSIDIYGRTPLHIAALKGYSQIIELLLADSKRTVNSRDLYGFTPLHLVQVYGKRKFFKRFSQAKSDMGSEARSYFLEKVDALDAHLRARTRNYQETMLVLLENGADIDAQDLTYGWAPLHWAAVNGDVWKAVTLVIKGATLNIPSKNDETPMFLARKWGRRVVYHFLKSKGAVW